MPAPQVIVAKDAGALARRAADEFVEAVQRSVPEGGRFAVALSGGKTPRAMLAELSTRPVEWARVHFFWSDERCVPPDDADSNYRMARETLLSKVDVPAGNVHRMKGELEPWAGASDYVAQLREFFGSQPAFDLLYLGLGPDGHTASLFPGTAALDVSDAPCVANRVDSGVASPWRLTLTYPAINAARSVAFLVEGADKAPILKEVVEGPRDVKRLPAQGVEPAPGALRWLVDAQAASLLTGAGAKR